MLSKLLKDRKLIEDIVLVIAVAHLSVGMLIIVFSWFLMVFDFTMSTVHWFTTLGFGTALFGMALFLSFGIYEFIKAVRN